MANKFALLRSALKPGKQVSVEPVDKVDPVYPIDPGLVCIEMAVAILAKAKKSLEDDAAAQKKYIEGVLRRLGLKARVKVKASIHAEDGRRLLDRVIIENFKGELSHKDEGGVWRAKDIMALPDRMRKVYLDCVIENFKYAPVPESLAPAVSVPSPSVVFVHIARVDGCAEDDVGPKNLDQRMLDAQLAGSVLFNAALWKRIVDARPMLSCVYPDKIYVSHMGGDDYYYSVVATVNGAQIEVVDNACRVDRLAESMAKEVDFLLAGSSVASMLDLL